MHRIIFKITLLSTFALALTIGPKVLAQTEDQDLDQIEAEINKKSESHLISPKPEDKKEAEADAKADAVRVNNLSDLSKLQPFSEVSTLERRYMPKSGRFQFYGGIAAIMNDPWNQDYGGNLRLAYGFTEAWGVEISDYFMSASQTQSAQDLQSNNNVNAQSFGSMAGYLGGTVMWTPIYGKFSLLNKRIVPFDMYFSLGGGTTSLNGGGTSSATGLTLGTGQVFSINRSVGFRWDMTWNMYSVPSTGGGVNSGGSMNNLLLSMGVCFYFPGATYR